MAFVCGSCFSSIKCSCKICLSFLLRNFFLTSQTNFETQFMAGFKIDKSVSHSSSQFIKLHFEWYWNVSWSNWRPITFFLITFVLLETDFFNVLVHSMSIQNTSRFRKICYIYATVPCLFKTKLLLWASQMNKQMWLIHLILD